jgi:cytoskeletal protein CcmA (bactofilin family)
MHLPDITEEILEDWPGIAREPDECQLEQSPEQFSERAPQPSEIVFEGVLRVNGYAAGVMRSSNGRLIVEAAGTVDADISVSEVTIHGCVRGDIRAAQVELTGSARVIGDIETLNLSIEPGATFEGRCVFLSPSEPGSSVETGIFEGPYE